MEIHYLGLDHVQVAAPAGCEEAARQFYHHLLGMPEVPKPENLQKRGGVCAARKRSTSVLRFPSSPPEKHIPPFWFADWTSCSRDCNRRELLYSWMRRYPA